MKTLLIALLLAGAAWGDEFGNPDRHASLTVIYNASTLSETDATVWNPLGAARTNTGEGYSRRWYWVYTQPVTTWLTLIHAGYYTTGMARWPATAQGWERSESYSRTVMLGGGVRVYLPW